MSAKRQPESVSEFKARLALMARERETGRKYSVIGAPRPPEWCRKQRENRHLQVCMYCGSVNEIVNQCGCDPNNLPTKPN